MVALRWILQAENLGRSFFFQCRGAPDVTRNVRYSQNFVETLGTQI